MKPDLGEFEAEIELLLAIALLVLKILMKLEVINVAACDCVLFSLSNSVTDKSEKKGGGGGE